MFAAAPQTSQPVSVEVLAESLCIDCQQFFTNSLVPTYHTLGPSVMDLKVVPYGNSHIDYDKHTVTCQHGEAECDANIWEQCAVDRYPPTVYMDFFECLEDGALPMGHRDDPLEESVFAECAAKTNSATQQESSLRSSSSSNKSSKMDFAALKSCHDNPNTAWSMQKKYAELTPDHRSVPWVMVDHQLIDVDRQDLLQVVCSAYTSKGGTHPACTSKEESRAKELSSTR